MRNHITRALAIGQRTVALAGLAILTVAPAARAQDAASVLPFAVFDKLFDNFTDFGLFTSGSRFSKNSQVMAKRQVTKKFPLRQFGAEFSWHVADVTYPICARKEGKGLDSAKTKADSITPANCWLKRDSAKAIPIRTCVVKPAEVTEVRVELSRKDTVRETHVYKGESECTPEKEIKVWDVEMGLAYVQSDPFVGKDASLQFSGSMKEVPRVSIYGTHQLVEIPWINARPYFGGSFGLTSLDDLRILGTETVTDTINHAPRDTVLTAPSVKYVEAGLAGGLATDQIGALRFPFSIFLEATYTWATFPSIKWTNEKFLRPGSPTSLNLSHWALSIGFQLGVKESK